MELDVGGICCRGLICTRSSAQTIHRGLRRMLTLQVPFPSSASPLWQALLLARAMSKGTPSPF
jgi:hypothetical protein